MLIYNPLPTKVTVQAHGSWFEFNPGQIKVIHNESIGIHLTTQKAYMGLVEVPDMVLENADSPEAKEAKAAAKERGISNRISELRKVIENLEVGLRKDLSHKYGRDIDPNLYASEGEVRAYKELKALKAVTEDAAATRAAEIAKLKGELDGDTVSADAE